MQKKNKQAGFTMLEILLSLAIVVLIAGFSIPIYHRLQISNNLDIAAVTATQTLRRAQVLSQAVDGDISWGVYIQSGSIILFKGTSYRSRDSSFDEVFDMPTSITSSGIQEFVYIKFSGLPQHTGMLTLSSSGNEIRNIIINEKGTVTY